MNEGWIKLHRCLMDKAIWTNSTPEQKTILITLLMMANHSGREWEWKGRQFKAEPGMLVTSLEHIVDKCGKGISIQNVRSALKKFEKYEFITQEVTKTGRLINIVNWGIYQGIKGESNKDVNKEATKDKQKDGRELTKSQQTADKDVTTNNNDRNIKNDKEGERKGIYNMFHIYFPTLLHKKIFNQIGDIAYRTWFGDASIDETDSRVIINVSDSFKKKIIKEKYLNNVTMLAGKEVVVI